MFSHIDNRDVRNIFFYFGSVLVKFFKKKNSDSVRNEFGSVPFKKRGLVRIL